MYSFRQSIPIVGMVVYVFETPCKLLFDFSLLSYDFFSGGRILLIILSHMLLTLC